MSIVVCVAKMCARMKRCFAALINNTHTHGTKTPIVTLLLSLNTHSVVAFVGNHRNSASFLQTISTNKISIYNSSVSVSIVFLLRFLPIRCHIVGSSDFIHFRSFYQIPHRLLFAGCYIMLMHTHTHTLQIIRMIFVVTEDRLTCRVSKSNIIDEERWMTRCITEHTCEEPEPNSHNINFFAFNIKSYTMESKGKNGNE